MTATTEDPTVTLRLWADGTGEVIVEGVAAPIAAGALGAARAQGLAQVQQLAARAGEPVRFVSYDPEGRWHLVMSPNGEVTEDDGTLPPPPQPPRRSPIRRRSPSRPCIRTRSRPGAKRGHRAGALGPTHPDHRCQRASTTRST